MNKIIIEFNRYIGNDFTKGNEFKTTMMINVKDNGDIINYKKLMDDIYVIEGINSSSIPHRNNIFDYNPEYHQTNLILYKGEYPHNAMDHIYPDSSGLIKLDDHVILKDYIKLKDLISIIREKDDIPNMVVISDNRIIKRIEMENILREEVM